MAGYSGTPLRRKIGIREDHRVYLHDPPDSLERDLGELPSGVELVGPRSRNLDVAMLFVWSSRELRKRFTPISKRLRKDGMIWVAWPKKASNVETDLDFGIVQSHGLACGLVDVKVCAIDETWSGLKFVYRKADR